MILAMAGGTPEHARVAAAVSAALARQLEGRRCAVFSESLRVRGAPEFAAYPDVTVVCGSLERASDSALTITNPTVVVEVLSPGTRDYDRGEKLEQYQRIPSIRHIVLVELEPSGITVVTREEQGFSTTVATSGQQAALPAIECELDVDSILRDPLSA